MEKLSVEMDLDDWEYVPDAGFLDFNQHEHGGKGKFSKVKGLDPKGVVRPFPSSRVTDIASVENSSVMSPVPIDLKMVKKNKNQELDDLDVNKVTFIDIGVIPPVNKDLGTVVADQDTVSRVFFKKMKENEFVEMKMDSPKSSSKGLKILTEAGSVKFEDKEETYKGESTVYKTSSEVLNDQEMAKKNLYLDSNIKKKDNWEDSLNIWRWKVNGVGALCCIGVAAATTICIFIFGGRGGKKQHLNQKIQFQIHSDDKKIKQVVHQEHIFSQAISAARDVPLNGAHIFFGGY